VEIVELSEDSFAPILLPKCPATKFWLDHKQAATVDRCILVSRATEVVSEFVTE
jgi:hypothetical protein